MKAFVSYLNESWPGPRWFVYLAAGFGGIGVNELCHKLF